MTRTAVALCCGMWMLAASGSAKAAGVRLEIHNRDTQPLRCVLILAHFMSAELDPIAPGAIAVLEVEREKTDGSLALRNGGQRPKMIENLLCGRQQDWAATRAGIPLSDLRVPGPDHLSISCAVEGRLRCGAWTEE